MVERNVSRAAQRRYARERDAYLQRKLGRVGSRPRIVAEYRGDVGWERSRRGRLDAVAAQEMRAAGVTIVRVRRLFITREIALSRYLR